MRNLIHANQRELEGTETIQRIPRQVRSLHEREFTRRVREAGNRERTMLVKVARAMKSQQA